MARTNAAIQPAAVYSYTACLSGEAPIVLDGHSLRLQTRNARSEVATCQATQCVYEMLRAHGLAAG